MRKVNKTSFIFLLFIVNSSSTHAVFEVQLNKGIALYHEQNYVEAINILTTLVNQHPNNPLVNHILGLAYFEIQDFNSAINYLENAKKLDPNLENINLDLGVAYFKADKLHNALKEFKQEASKSPDTSSLVYYYLGYTNFLLGQHKEAIINFENVSKADDEIALPSYYYSALSKYRQSDFNKAKADFESVIKLNESDKLASSSREYIDLINSFSNKYYGTLSVGYQYDTNVGLEPEDIDFVSGKSDSSLIYFLNLGYKPYQTSDSVIGIDYSTFFFISSRH